jgi:hypothetical protein
MEGQDSLWNPVHQWHSVPLGGTYDETEPPSMKPPVFPFGLGGLHALRWKMH